MGWLLAAAVLFVCELKCEYGETCLHMQCSSVCISVIVFLLLSLEAFFLGLRI